MKKITYPYLHWFIWRTVLLSLVIALPAFSSAQESEPVSKDNTQTQIEVLQSLLKAQGPQEAEIERLRGELAVVQSAPDKERLEKELGVQVALLEESRRRFEESASGAEISIFEEDEETTAFSWEETLGKILEPILEEAEKATANSRKRNALTAEHLLYSERAEVAAVALKKVDALLLEVEDSTLLAALQSERVIWEERMILSENRARAANLQLEELEAKDPGWLSGSTNFIRQFLAVRGLNLIYGILAAMAVFFGVRFLMTLAQKVRKGRDAESFANRVFLLMTNILSIVGAVAALLIAFSAVGDLFLLGIVLIILIGAAWAGIQVIPQFLESIKLILNIGMVREKQRLVFDGIPWIVESLGFSCVMVNEELDNGKLTLPVRRLVGLNSRPICEDEELFPMRRGEWVELSDGTIGESAVQNPATITLREWGGAEKTFSTVDFLDLAPRNLTRNGFQVSSTFGIDYSHQEIATSQVPEWFVARLKAGLPKVVGADDIRDIQVLFSSASASSLDYEIHIDLKGAAACKYREVKFAVQQLLVEACNEHNLSIPFQQITIHRADG